MSYQVLARKWRPRRFAELVGQEHVVRALSHALDAGRIHHAFLFTGTRGVGKTTIARIFAKSLNCERGVSSNPCGECGACRDIDAGRFLDLLEIDAASNTGVDDVREVIENAQYVPARGAYKVYLIDEVHMLSKSAFNALLKTLEEPPPHVKFLLATTDPQKLPVTVLSRCLQFHLKRLGNEQIEGQLTRILAAEAVTHDQESVRELARGGNGSMRDALSLLDQAIAYGGGALRADEVRTMLGTIDRARVRELLLTLARADAAALWAEVETIAEFAPDFGVVLDELATLLHRVQLAQLVPSVEDHDPELVRELAAMLHPEDVQLMYQLALSGRRDLALAPGPRIGFEMTLLRMLAFRPGAAAASSAPTPVAVPQSVPRGKPGAAPQAASRSTAPMPAASPVTTAPAAAAAVREPVVSALDVDRWQDLLAPLGLRGPLRELAHNAVPLALESGRLRLGLKPAHEHLRSDALVRQLTEVLAPALGSGVRLQFEPIDGAADSVADKQRRDDASRQRRAEAAIAADPVVQGLVTQFDAKVVPDSARPTPRE